ncbi:MAG TPA: GNAT family N-acetyltransferase [Cyclobacteriaceae bacterium]|jgi:GNAT superfamily N-acetyltransferase|nr:GNAT family N-acetyltransferase [Cyclobacteriaceae bacterium]
MIIREADEKDADILSQLLMQLGYPTPIHESKRRIQLYHQEGYKLFMAELSNQPIGFIALHWYHAVHHPHLIGRVVAFCIDESVRGKGCGSQLLKYAEDFFQDLSCVKVELTSNLRRKESHTYYLRKGYQQTSMHFVKFLAIDK